MTQRIWMLIALGVLVLAALAFVLVGVEGQLDMRDEIDKCKSRGGVWLGGEGVSRDGCYDLTRIRL